MVRRICGRIWWRWCIHFVRGCTDSSGPNARPSALLPSFSETTMQLVEQHIIDRSDSRWQAIDAAAWASKNIYNVANYRVRQCYIREGRYLSYETLEKQFKQKDLLADQQLPMKVVQQVL